MQDEVAHVIQLRVHVIVGGAGWERFQDVVHRHARALK